MSVLSRLDRHADLFGRMARTVDAELGEAMLNGRAGAETMRTAFVACTGCTSPEECAAWLDAHPDGAGEAPEFCRNQRLLKQLSRP